MASVMFELVVKSSLDRLCNQIVADMIASGDEELVNLAGAGLDDIVNLDGVVKTTSPAIVWELLSFAPHPRDPLYVASFTVGAKTTQDDANYVQSKMVALLAGYFRVDEAVYLKDYSVAVEDLPDEPDRGVMFINEVSTNPTQFDNQSGFRLITVNARLQRYI